MLGTRLLLDKALALRMRPLLLVILAGSWINCEATEVVKGPAAGVLGGGAWPD